VGVSFEQLRERCQRPVRERNDVAGLVYGDRASLPITKLFVDLDVSPDVATVGMLVCGLAGSALQLVGPAAAFWGAVLLVLYYVLDCVDGEVARFRGVENIRWGYHEYVFHMLVKPVCFGCVGVAAWWTTGSRAAVYAGMASAVAVLWLKLLHEVPAVQMTRYVLGTPPERNRAFRRFVEGVETGPGAGTAEGSGVFRLGWNRVTLRALATNFDIGLLALVVATGLDSIAGPLVVGGVGPLTARLAWCLFYGVVVPLDFLDHLQTHLRRDEFGRTLGRMMRQAHEFDAQAHRRREGREEEEEPGQGAADGGRRDADRP